MQWIAKEHWKLWEIAGDNEYVVSEAFEKTTGQKCHMSRNCHPVDIVIPASAGH